ncbi:phosphatase PAP2 family protein [Flindersiella endophytica]
MRFKQSSWASVVGSVAALVAVTVLAWAAGPVSALDQLVARWMEALQSPAGSEILRALNSLGRLEFLAGLLVCVAMTTARRTGSWIPVSQAAFTVLAGNLVVSGLKLLTARPAPAAGVVDFLAGGVSYPSGHVTNAVAAGGCLLALTASRFSAPEQPAGLTRCIQVAAVALPVVVSVAVLYLGYHWLTDVLAGLAIGVLVNSTRAILTAASAPFVRTGWARIAT